MASITIDGKELEFQAGQSIIEIADGSGVEIPYYCWHPKLSVAANCRMCLVEVEKAPKLLPACQTECRDGMVVHTKNEKVADAQKSVHEFLLINHPIDCPICDQAGECKLQNYYMQYQLDSSRMQDQKVNKPRLEKLGPNVVYNGERCILCTRCIRFMEEVAGDRQLGVFNRGDHAHIGTFPGTELDNPYSMNVVDVCPVGALTSNVFRFKQRVWNLDRSDSVCPGCAKGCNVHVDQRSGQVYRMLPRDNDDVNQCWMCDEGRLTYSRANDERLTQPLMAGDDGPRESSVRDALAEAVRLLQPAAEAGSGLALAISAFSTCEEAYVLGRFGKELCKVEGVVLLDLPDGDSDELLRVADKNPNRKGVTRVLEGLGLAVWDGAAAKGKLADGSIKAGLMVGHETGDPKAAADLLAKLEVLVQVAHARTPLSEAAHVTLPSVSWVQLDGTWINGEGRAQRLNPAFAPEGAARPAHEWLVELASAMGSSLALPSVETIRAEMERNLDGFKSARLNDLGPQGQVVA